MAKATDPDESLKRLGGGRWQTRDERFIIEPQSGTWVVVDAEQTDELGLSLVRGPFGSLGAAKAAIVAAREADPKESPLAERAAKLRDRPETEREATGDPPRRRSTSAKSTSSGAPAVAKSAKSAAASTHMASAEPKWVQALDPADRRRAKRLIDRLTELGAPDPEGMVRRDLVGEVPAVAGFAVSRALRELGVDAEPSKVARLLADGRDEELGVRWRLVDGDERPVTIDLDAP
ncbi:MAG: hypothetical protein QOD78_359 [Chloroflexota bacterium]|jgi:hypothetical protein|nr:hypothetical protein [Chloroflexota bacterium]